jgi:hypothetical protein
MERLDRFYFYSAFENLPILTRYWMNMNTAVAKIGAHHVDSETQICDFL